MKKFLCLLLPITGAFLIGAAAQGDYYIRTGSENGSYESTQTEYIPSTATAVPTGIPRTDTSSDGDYYIRTGSENGSYESARIEYIPSTALPTVAPGTNRNPNTYQKVSSGGTLWDYYIKAQPSENGSYESTQIEYIP